MTYQVDVYDIEGNIKEKIELPIHFGEEIREDVIRRAFLVQMSHTRQPYGKYKYAGLETSAWTHKERRTYRTSYGYGISRVPRAVVYGLPHMGTPFSWIARGVPQAVKGPKIHGPTTKKNLYLRINKKERRLAIRSAIAATANKYYIIKRYNKKELIEKILSDKNLPIVVDGIENINKTKDLINVIYKIGLGELYEHFREDKKIRAGRGKTRGRRIVKNRGILLVVSDKDKEKLSTDGLEISDVRSLDLLKLSPGGKPGRITIWSKAAIENLRNLYL